MEGLSRRALPSTRRLLRSGPPKSGPRTQISGAASEATTTSNRRRVPDDTLRSIRVQARQLKSPDLAGNPRAVTTETSDGRRKRAPTSLRGGARALARARRPGLRRPGGSLMTVWAVIEHVSYDGQGNVRQALSRAGLRSVTLRPLLGDELPSVTDLSGLIVLGAPTGSADDSAPRAAAARAMPDRRRGPPRAAGPRRLLWGPARRRRTRWTNG